ncbi:MAG: porin family protein [Acidobacteriota bacterium]|nr:porin family protein [Acidobacteriota bacterium]
MRAPRAVFVAIFVASLASSTVRAADEALPVVPRPETAPDGIAWQPLLKESLTFLAMQHAFRVVTEPDTRAGLGGPFFGGWARSVENLHGWADGDPFFVNYLGHPLEGAVSGFLFIQNDRKYTSVQFGRNRNYWRSRLRAAAWAWAYSTQFEIGPISEASIGKVQSHFPQQGFVDHVITPTFGLAWIVAEDAVDKYLIRRIEAHTNNRDLRILARGFLNPSRSMSNMIRGELPWHRDTREGTSSYAPPEISGYSSILTVNANRGEHNERRYAPFEIAVQYGYSQLGSGAEGALSCNGGGASVLFNFNPHLGLESEIGGCKMLSPAANVSGDSMFYLAGPRYTFRDLGHWSPYIHALAGGERLSSETFYPDKKPVMTAALSKLDGYELHSLYTSDSETMALALQLGGGVDYTINRALAFRVADLEYLRTWAPEFNGANPRNNVRFETGLVLRMGNW